MADPSGEKSDGEGAVTQDGSGSDGRAATKAKVNNIWEELRRKDSLPAKLGLIKVQKVVKPSKPSKPVPSWMVNLGLAPPGGSLAHDPGHVRREKFLKLENGGASNSLLKGSPVSSNQDKVEPKESPKVPHIDSTVNEVLSRPREAADTSTSSNSIFSEGSKDSKAAQALRRKSDKEAPSAGLDDLLQQIRKKQKPNILDRSRKDWGQFKQENGLKDELEAYKKSGDEYLDKVAFLQRSDVREYEKERDIRLALQSKRQSETVPVD